jgi:hypothetical protein
MVKLTGFSPLAPAGSPGVMLECMNVIPCLGGFQTAHVMGGNSTIAAPGVAALGSGGYATEAGTTRMIVAVGDRLLAPQESWFDRGRAAAYAVDQPPHWVFSQFGGVSLASNIKDPIQFFSAGKFGDIAGAPKARIVFAVGDFVMALNTDDATYGVQPDAWWCSGIFDYAAWTPSVSTQANRGQLRDVEGPLTAGLALGKQAVAYKRDAMWLGSYVGGAEVWRWERVQGSQGCVYPSAVCEAESAHYFIAADGFCRYDGVRAQYFGADIWQWLRKTYPTLFDQGLIVGPHGHTAIYERNARRVWFILQTSTPSGGIALVYSIESGFWGMALLNQKLGEFGLTPTKFFPSNTNTNAFIAVEQVNRRHLGMVRTGRPSTCFFKTGLVGDEQRSSLLSEVRLGLFNASDGTEGGTVIGRTFATSRGFTPVLVTGGATNPRDGAFHLRQTGRWHQIEFRPLSTADFESVGFDIRPAGMR